MTADDVQPDLDELLRPESTAEDQLLARLFHPSTAVGNQLLQKLGLTRWPAGRFDDEFSRIGPPRGFL